MSKEFHSWRSKHFVQVSEYTWRPKNPDTEKRIRDELARHAVAIKLEDATQGIPDPLHCNQPFCWDDSHRQRIQRFMATNEVALPDGRDVPFTVKARSSLSCASSPPAWFT